MIISVQTDEQQEYQKPIKINKAPIFKLIQSKFADYINLFPNMTEQEYLRMIEVDYILKFMKETNILLKPAKIAESLIPSSAFEMLAYSLLELTENNN